MASYSVEYTPEFLHRHYIKVPSKIQKTLYGYIERLEDGDTTMPFPQNDIKKLKGYDNLYRLRIGRNYRLIYKQVGTRVTCLKIGPRANVYHAIQYDPDQAISTFTTVSNSTRDAGYPPQSDIVSLEDKQENTAFLYPKEKLPHAITSTKLNEWNVALEYHDRLQGISSVEDLFDLFGTIPEDLLEKICDKIYPPETDQEIIEQNDIRNDMRGLLQFKCPIKGCNKVFNNTRGGWDAHVASSNTHKNWHPDVIDPEERKQLFKNEFPEWLGAPNAEMPREKNSKKKEFKCPIKGCNKVFNNTRGGWDAHVASSNTHKNWHPDVIDPEERKQIFKNEFPEFFSLDKKPRKKRI